MSSPDFSTGPKPFVFVLMPFDEAFDDIYKYGIKGAADDAGAYAERVDEQSYTEGILDRIFNQINKADVIVADMTGRNANVFYEVGYAHALGKLVLLVTQRVDDIPFDLKHRPHILYEGKIETLRTELGPKIQWALGEGQRLKKASVHRTLLDIIVFNTIIPESNVGTNPPEVGGIVSSRNFSLPVLIRNASREESPPISYVYLVLERNCDIYPIRWVSEQKTVDFDKWSLPKTVQVPQRLRSIDVPGTGSASEVQTRLRLEIPALPSDAVEEVSLSFELGSGVREASELLKIRFHSAAGTFEHPFRLTIKYVEPPSEKASAAKPQSSKSEAATTKKRPK